MSQSNHSVGNVSAPVFRSDMNASLQALASLNSGSTAPSTTYANMLWYDTANNILKMRSEADDAWINVGYLDQTANAFRILDDTQVVNTSGTQTGLLGDQATATWESGVATTESLVSPAKVRAAVKPALNAIGSAPIYACRAWVRFNTDGSIFGAGNVSSVIRNAAGDYYVNFSVSMPDSNYSVVASTGSASFILNAGATEYDTFRTRITVKGGANQSVDAIVSVSVFR